MTTAALIEAAQTVETSGSKRKEVPETTVLVPAPTIDNNSVPGKMLSFFPKQKKQATSQSRALRLEQNRKAARESRRRKKAMVEELQRSLMFFSKSNATLKQQNEVLTRQVLDAHNKLAKMGVPLPPLDPKLTEGAAPVAETPKVEEETKPEAATNSDVIMKMQPGATMQAMANFQQAAHVAMAMASQKMQAQGVVVNSEKATV